MKALKLHEVPKDQTFTLPGFFHAWKRYGTIVKDDGVGDDNLMVIQTEDGQNLSIQHKDTVVITTSKF